MLLEDPLFSAGAARLRFMSRANRNGASHPRLLGRTGSGAGFRAMPLPTPTRQPRLYRACRGSHPRSRRSLPPVCRRRRRFARIVVWPLDASSCGRRNPSTRIGSLNSCHKCDGLSHGNSHEHLAQLFVKSADSRLSQPSSSSYIPAPTDSLIGTPRRLAAKDARTGRRSRTRTHDD
jgi:hypothetical protein